METFGMTAFCSSVLSLLLLSCHQEEKINPNTGIATFSLHEKERINGRADGSSIPSFVLLNIQASNGIELKEIKLNLFSFGASFLTENLELPMGSYYLTEFVVYDASNKPIYVTPKTDSEMEKFVSASLPIEFSINPNGTSVTTQVISVLADDEPQRFGYTNFLLGLTGPRGKVKEVVFHDLFIDDAVTTMDFEYSNERIETVRWTFDYPSAGIREGYIERRFYSARGELDSLAGGKFNGNAWSLSYGYIDGKLNEIKSYRNDTISTVSFLKYVGTKPILIENLYGIYGIYDGANYPQYTTFEFDEAGNLVTQKNTDIPGHPSVTQEKITTYTSELNPLRNLIETPLPQVIEHYDDLAFYFSANLPSSVEANYPYVYPVNNRITFEYSKDEDGRITHIRALRPDRNSLRYTLDISYY